MNGLLGDPILVLVAAGIGFSVLCLFFAFGDDSKRKQARRVDRLRLRGQGLTTETLQLRRDSGDRRLIDQFVRRFLPRPELMRQRLQRSGRSIGLGTYGIACLIVAALAGGGIVFSGFSVLVAVPGALLMGLWLPHLFIGFLVKRRATRFTNLFPEAIGLMVRGLKSGLPVTETFQIVAQEIADPVGNEFRQVSDQIRLGHPVEQALWDAARRVGTPELKFLVVTLSIQRETGGNLAETFENLDTILRRRRQMRLKIRAMSSEARASAMIIGSLPFIMVGILSVVNQSYIALLFTTQTGHHLLGAAAFSMAMGVGVMAKLIRFEI